MNKSECVKVTMRCRPLNKQEMSDGRQVIINISPSRGEILVKSPNNDQEDKAFTFDNVFDWTSTQEGVYNDTAYPIVQSVIEGYNGTIFAYGQTGTGKTFTMEGVNQNDLHGIIPRTFDHIFNTIGGTPDKNFLVRASYLELYNEEVRDLLSKNYKNKMDLRENPDSGVYIKDLSNFIVQDAGQLRDKLALGAKSRSVGETKMNRESSRSHSLFCIIVEGSVMHADGTQHITQGKLNLVDLAGSERQAKTGAVGDRFKEAISINQSLTTLGNVISSLVDSKSSHVPYRDSKLTRLLQDSLGGNTKTVMIANIGPADYNFDETLSSLRYASRAKNIKNKPKINEDPKDAMIRQFQDEITQLKMELAKKMGNPESGGGSGGQKQVIEVEQIMKVQDDEKLRQIEQRLISEKQQFAAQMEQERNNIEKQKNLAVEEKQKLLRLIDQKEEKQAEIQENKKGLVQKLKQMEEKLVQGSKIKQQAMLQERELLKAKQDLDEKKQRERYPDLNFRRLKEELEQKAANQLQVEEKYNSIKEEIEVKTSKLNTLIEKIQETQQQKDEIKEYRLREKDILMEENRNLTRELKLLDLIIENFVPQEEVQLLNDRLQYDEDQDEWFVKEDILQQVSKPESAIGLRYPMTEFSRMAVGFGDVNPRYRYDNILHLDLDLPEQTTEEFDGQISQKLQETINISLNDNEEEILQLQQDMKPNYHIQEVKPVEQKQKKLRPQSGIKKT